MKISYGSLTICGEGESPKNLSVSMRKRIQSDDIIESAMPIVGDRGNIKSTVSFAVERAHKSPAEAEMALFAFMRGVALESPARLEISVGGNVPGECVALENAALAKCSASVDGIITTHAFEFSEGRKEKE